MTCPWACGFKVVVVLSEARRHGYRVDTRSTIRLRGRGWSGHGLDPACLADLHDVVDAGAQARELILAGGVGGVARVQRIAGVERASGRAIVVVEVDGPVGQGDAVGQVAVTVYVFVLDATLGTQLKVAEVVAGVMFVGDQRYSVTLGCQTGMPIAFGRRAARERLHPSRFKLLADDVASGRQRREFIEANGVGRVRLIRAARELRRIEIAVLGLVVFVEVDRPVGQERLAALFNTVSVQVLKLDPALAGRPLSDAAPLAIAECHVAGRRARCRTGHWVV